MSTLYERLIQDMQLRGFSPRTQEAYARAVRQLADHYQKSPDLVTEEELREYFLYRTNVSRWSRVACTIALCGIKFFYEQTLRRDWATVGLAKPKRVKSLPTVLSLAEVRRALACVHMFRHRVCLATLRFGVGAASGRSGGSGLTNGKKAGHKEGHAVAWGRASESRQKRGFANPTGGAVGMADRDARRRPRRGGVARSEGDGPDLPAQRGGLLR